MNKVAKTVAGFIAGISILTSAGASFLYSQRDTIIAAFATKAADLATKTIGTKVEIGSVKINDLHTNENSDITVSDLAIYDKNLQLIAKAQSAEVNFRLLAMTDDPIAAIDEIKISNVEGNIVKRTDDTWNFNDIKTSGEGESNFNADILIENVEVNANFDGNDLNIAAPNLKLDFDTTANFNAKLNDAKVVGSVEGNDIDAAQVDLDLDFDHSNINADFSIVNADLNINLESLNNQSDNEDLNMDSDFPAIVLAASVDRKSINIDKFDGKIKFDENSNINAEIKALTQGSNLHAVINSEGNKQVIDIDADTLNVEEVLPFIPQGTLPAGIEIQSGQINDAQFNIIKRSDNYNVSGSAKVQDGSVKVEQTDIDDINGSVIFNDEKILIDASAQANGQYAAVEGSIRIDTDTPYLDLQATSDSFNPNAVMYLPAEGTAAFTAHLTGTTSDPIVEADLYSPYITYENLSAANVSTHLKYQNNAVYLTDLKANTFGGMISGDFELYAMDLSYNANLKVTGVEASQLIEFIPKLEGVNGRIYGDIGINGVSDNLDMLKVYGSASASNVNYENFEIDKIDTSFYVNGDDVKIDYLSATLPNSGSIGVEGTIMDGDKLDLKFYAAHVDLTAAENFLPQIELSGLADFKGSVHGDIDNPDVQLMFSAVDISQFGEANKNISPERIAHFKGVLFDQPYDTIKFTASGSLDGIEVNDFHLSRGGKDIWLAKGKVGLTGEKNIELQVDTVGARAEDIIRLVKPDQPLTGNVDNIITVTGTLDKPELTGYIHFWYGSYRGMLVNSMDGDYFIEGNKIRLQDFHINSPMVDMDLNGTIDRVTTDMDFTVEVHDIDVRRFQSKLPENYPAQGHGTFSGIVKGNIGNPIFDGTLVADNLSFNGVEIDDVNGHVNINGSDIIVDNFTFNQGEGSYNVHAKVNYETNSMSGRSQVTNVDIPELFALANIDNKLITGKLNSNINFGGTLNNPTLQLEGSIPKGTFGGSDIHDININVNLLNHVIYIHKLEGFQGEVGELNATGSANLYGELDVKINASNLELAMFTKAAGVDAEVVGTANVDATINGTVDNPAAQAEIIATGGIKGSTFDLMRGNFNLKDGIVDVQELIAQRAIGEKIYQVSAKGLVPLVSLTADKKLKLNSNEQINLDISLDNADLSLLPLISEQYISWAIGEMAGNLKVTGTAANPLINGAIELHNGTIKVKGMKSLIEHMNMILAFKGNKMDIEDFTGNIGNGNYNLTGGLSINGLDISDYNFTFKANKLNIKSSFYNGLLNGEFNLSREQIPFGVFPKIAGHLDFDNCMISIPSIPESEGELPNILLDVSVNLGDKVHFYSPYLFDIYLTGSANFGGSTTRPKPSGIITAKRGGTVNYLKTVFNVREGELQFNQIDSFFPNITFFADTKVSKTKVFLSVGGRLNDRSIRLTSSPELSETEIIQLLTLRDAYQKGGDNDLETGDLLLLGLQMSFLSEIEGAVRKTFGFDQFSISRGSGSAFDSRHEVRDRHEEEYNVTMGKYITDNIMLKYTRGIGGDNINRYGFQYDFNDKISATFEREGHANILGFEARWKF